MAFDLCCLKEWRLNWSIFIGRNIGVDSNFKVHNFTERWGQRGQGALELDDAVRIPRIT